jgi:hypothetical protein
MPVPITIIATSRLRHLFSLLVVSCLLAPPLLARNPDPSLRIPLEPLGFQPLSTQFLLAGSSMLTLHYVDDKHLLVTFSTRRLMKRLPDDPPEDQDRYVAAVLLELPSGRILGRTDWRLHDHGQYLWSLGHGHFLLRIRDTLTTFAPLANLSTGQPFREHPFISTDRRIGGVILSPDADLLILETIERPPSSAAATPPDPPKPVDPTPVHINLFRLAIPPGSGGEVGVQMAGSARSRIPGRIPATTAGYLAIIDQGKQRWAFDFNSYTGKNKELSPFDSTCRPQPMFVSRSEFVAFGCHSGHALQVIGGFNMKGEEMWEQTFLEPYIAPSFAYAPAGGRFALSRILARSAVSGADSLIPELISGQSVIVYQTDSGKQILHVESLPVQRAGQNFALSPDGMSLAIIHGDAVEIYRLPPLTPNEQAAVKEAQAMAPETNDVPIRFSGLVAGAAMGSSTQSPAPAASPDQPAQPARAADNPTGTSPSAAGDVSTNPSAGAPAPAAPPANQSSSDGDSAPQEQPRKPPTLYNSPADTPPAPQPAPRK